MAGFGVIRTEWNMFLGFLIAVGLIVLLTLVGAFIARRAPGTEWESHEDRPIGPWMDH